MLFYIYTVLQDILIPATLFTLMAAWFKVEWDHDGTKPLWISLIAGTVIALIMAVIRNTTRVFKSTYSIYVMWLCFGIVVAALLFVAGAFLTRRCGRKATVYLAVPFTVLYTVYKFSGVLGYLFTFDTDGNSILSANYAVRLVGWLIGLILLGITMRNLYRVTTAYNRPGNAKGLSLIITVIALVRCLEPVLKPWVSGTRRNLPAFLPVYSKKSFPWAFSFTKWVYNNDLTLTIIVAALALIIPCLLFIRELRIHDPYENPAQLRKLKANGRRNRRRAVTVLICAVIAVVFITAVKAWDSREVTLSAPESYMVAEKNVTIPLVQVEDGHLHRFEYKTDSGVTVRWIVIKKPNSSVYGVGLDACDVCGNAGYYERDDQVVCKRCDVVMNKSTIGFKGGCNPIPLSYTIEDGQMIISLDDLNNAEKQFK